MTHRSHVCFIVPPYMLRKLAEDPAHRDAALRALETTEQLRGARQATAIPPPVGTPAGKHRTIYDARHLTTLPGTKVQDEGGKATSTDIAVEGGLRLLGRHLRLLREGVLAQLGRRSRPGAEVERALRRELRQRVLERPADGLRRRRRPDLPALHQEPRRHRTRVDPRRPRRTPPSSSTRASRAR